jgi:DNA modification methylase
MFEVNNIYNINCIQGMNQLKQKIKLIIADPPYVISKQSNFHTMPDRKNQRTGTNFGSWDNEFDNTEWINKSYEISDKGGSLIVFNDFKKATNIYDIATKAGYEYKDTIIWHKTNPMPRNRDRRYIPDIEMLQWYVKPGAKWTFNRQNNKYESCIMSFPSESGGGFKRYHPCQKPVKLLEQLIRIHSNEGDLIVDPFLGGGSTMIACMDTGRNCIGFELDKEIFEVAKKRIEDYKIKN